MHSKSNSAKNVTPMQKMSHQRKLHIEILDYDWPKDNRTFSKPMISRKMMTKFLGGAETLKKRFLE